MMMILMMTNSNKGEFIHHQMPKDIENFESNRKTQERHLLVF